MAPFYAGIDKRGIGMILISHDLHLVSTFCERVLVMFGGKIVESLMASELHAAQHPYTQGLLNCMPDLDRKKRKLEVLNRDPAWLDDEATSRGRSMINLEKPQRQIRKAAPYYSRGERCFVQGAKGRVLRAGRRIRIG